jgi:hypothetical protein
MLIAAWFTAGLLFVLGVLYYRSHATELKKKPAAARMQLDPKESAAISAHVEARREIEQNVRYILGKLPSLDVPVELKNQIEHLCYQFYDALCGMTPLPLDALDRLVRQLDADPKLALASILITESGANILRVRAGLDTPPPALAERRFDCVECGRAAGVLRLLEDHTYERRSFTSNMSGGSALSPEDFEKLRGIIETGDLDALYDYDLEIASFYCTVCRACYCQGHWKPWDVFDEDGWHDSIRGRCPKGHERMLED